MAWEKTGNIARWLHSLPDARSIVIIGDSVSEGQGSVTSVQNRWGNKLSDALRAKRGLPAGNIGWIPASTSALDQSLPYSFTTMQRGSSMTTAFTATGLPGAMKFGTPADQAWIGVDQALPAMTVHLYEPSGGSTYANAPGGGSFTTSTAPTAGRYGRYRVPAGGGNLYLNLSAGTSYLLGMDGRIDDALVVHTIARSGATITDWNAWLAGTGGAQSALRVLTALAPDLVLVQLGGNDIFGGSSSPDETSWRSRLTTLKATLDGLPTKPAIRYVVTPLPAKLLGGMASYWQQYIDVASQILGGLLDARSVPNQDAQPSWYHSDGVHLGDRAASEIATVIASQINPA
ncbi:SGNH/GDSL hydrolase family protein [Nakamurella aerolata]|uniref:SGNH hydrolase-type esterase domain-containing protein n=1 Tax=Nakamurella aerolata TaxID=1656892 RepID=A0A849AAH1_9ACTN|nr:SGNH/GDSL hydrolase family protein [Nakamurella aerolata]NNG36957.1 hypothetical protein [Nakamurella aerolata]